VPDNSSLIYVSTIGIPEWDSGLNCSGASTAVRGGQKLQKAYRT
jgi:hypothetical protein